MKGKLVNTNNGWVIRVKPNDERIRQMISYGDDVEIIDYPLHPEDVEKHCKGVVFFADVDIDFELVEVYVEPPDTIHCNRGSNVKYAKISTSWDNIFDDYQKENYPPFGGPFDDAYTLSEWLKKNFHPPKRK